MWVHYATKSKIRKCNLSKKFLVTIDLENSLCDNNDARIVASHHILLSVFVRKNSKTHSDPPLNGFCHLYPWQESNLRHMA